MKKEVSFEAVNDLLARYEETLTGLGRIIGVTRERLEKMRERRWVCIEGRFYSPRAYGIHRSEMQKNVIYSMAEAYEIVFNSEAKKSSEITYDFKSFLCNLDISKYQYDLAVEKNYIFVNNWVYSPTRYALPDAEKQCANSTE